MSASPGALQWIVFLICSLGTVSTWIVLFAVFFQHGEVLIPAIAGTFVTILELAWALGMIWGMNPYEFPPAFCKWQAIAISTGAYGLSASFAVLASAVWLNLNASPSSKPRNPLHVTRKLLPVWIGYPACCTTIYALMGDYYHSWGPSWFTCDSLDPPWIRLLSYAGLDWIAIVPAMVLVLLILRRLFTLRRELTKASMPERTPTPSTATAPTVLGVRQSPLGRPQGITQRILEIEGITSMVWDGREIRRAPVAPTDQSPQSPPSPPPPPITPAPVPTVPLGVLRARNRPRSIEETEMEEASSKSGDGQEEDSARRDHEARNTLDAIFRVVVLLLVCILTQALASISPFMAIAQNRVDHGFGTNHLAGCAAAFVAPMTIGVTPAFRNWISRTWQRTRRRSTARENS